MTQLEFEINSHKILNLKFYYNKNDENVNQFPYVESVKYSNGISDYINNSIKNGGGIVL